MSESREVTRREFSLEAAMALLSGVAITITGCGGGGSNPSGPSGGGGTANGDNAGVVSANHGHSAVIKSAQLMAGGALALDIQGSSTHTHSVALSAANMQAVASNQRVALTSSTGDGHTHTVTFN